MRRRRRRSGWLPIENVFYGPCPAPFLPSCILPFSLPSSHQVCRDAKTFGDRPNSRGPRISIHIFGKIAPPRARNVRPGQKLCEWPYSCAASAGQFLLGGTFKIPFRRRRMWDRGDRLSMLRKNGDRCGEEVWASVRVRPMGVPISRSGMERRRGRVT